MAPQDRRLDRERKVDHVGKHGVPKGRGALRLRVRESFTDENETNEREIGHEKHGYHEARLGMLSFDGLHHDITRDDLVMEVFVCRQQWLLLHGLEAIETI